MQIRRPCRLGRRQTFLVFLISLFWSLLTESADLTQCFLLWAEEVKPGAKDVLPGAEQWQEAQAGYALTFPRDHAAHPSYRTEWWYYTGNLETVEGRRFGYQLTFFRTGVTLTPTSSSRWAVRDLYMAHFAIADLTAQRFVFFERLNRAGVQWAGADTTQYHVWNEAWEVQRKEETHTLAAREGNTAIALQLTPEKQLVRHGAEGLSRKGAAVGNASYYYSFTRLRTEGTLQLDGTSYHVTGLSWMDHEFGTSFLEKEQSGWDWFSLQLHDGRELMLFQVRRTDGSIDPSASGTLVERDGGATHLSVKDFTLVPEKYWSSPESGARYPVVWTLTIPEQHLQFCVQAALQNQELRTVASTGVTYWEGSVEVIDVQGRPEAAGRGYLEMTGYNGEHMGPLFGGQ